MAQLVGLITGWWVLLPILTQGGADDPETLANTVFRADVSFFGAGVIAVAALWTLVKIAGPVLRSEEHTAELQSLIRTSSAVYCLTKNNLHIHHVHRQTNATR